MTEYLGLEEVLYLHQEIIKKTGGKEGILDFGLLHASIERPKASFGGQDLYFDIFAKAAALIHSLVLNHPFIDGNKRAGLVAMIRFLEINGVSLQVTTDELLKLVLDIEAKKYSIKSLSSWIREHIVSPVLT